MSPSRPASPRPPARPDDQRVTLTARGVERVRARVPWIFRADVARGPATDARDGGPYLVDVLDGRGHRLGRATWAAEARLALRMIGFAPPPGAATAVAGANRSGDIDTAIPAGGDAEELLALVEARLDVAIGLRASLRLDRDAYRVVHAEADGLPGLIIDRYADAAVVQTNAVAMDAARARIAELVARKLDARLVVARDDGSARDFEGLPRFADVLVDAAGTRQTRVVYRLGPNRLEADLLRDSKTGGFLDQADNHAAVAALAPERARALDAFSFHGGFALALARRGGPVTATDENPDAVARIQANAARNGLANLTARHANAFDLLRQLESEGARFDVVVLDPPALAKRGAAIGERRAGADAAADRAYHELILRGARLTEPGGLLVACSCSGRVSREHFDELVRGAVADAGRSAHVLARRGAAADHPELVALPETAHLKCWVLRVI